MLQLSFLTNTYTPKPFWQLLASLRWHTTGEIGNASKKLSVDAFHFYHFAIACIIDSFDSGKSISTVAFTMIYAISFLPCSLDRLLVAFLAGCPILFHPVY